MSAPSFPPSSAQLAAFRRATDKRTWLVAQVRPCGAMAHEIAHGIGAQDATVIGLPAGGGWAEVEAGEMYVAMLQHADDMRQRAYLPTHPYGAWEPERRRGAPSCHCIMSAPTPAGPWTHEATCTTPGTVR